MLELLWQIVKFQQLKACNPSSPELAGLKKLDESIDFFAQLSPEDLLVRWLNNHLLSGGTDLRVDHPRDLQVGAQ